MAKQRIPRAVPREVLERRCEVGAVRGRASDDEPPADVLDPDDERWSRVEAEANKYTRRLAASSRGPLEVRPIERAKIEGKRIMAEAAARAASAQTPKEEKMPEMLTGDEAVEEYKRWSKTFDGLGLRPLFAPNTPILAFLPVKLTGKALAKRLRIVAAGLVKHAVALEAKADEQATAEADEESADF